MPLGGVQVGEAQGDNLADAQSAEQQAEEGGAVTGGRGGGQEGLGTAGTERRPGRDGSFGKVRGGRATTKAPIGEHLRYRIGQERNVRVRHQGLVEAGEVAELADVGPVDKYEQVFAIGGRPITDQPKRLHHVCYRTGDVGFVVVVVWEDEASFAAFGEIIGPATQKVGLDAKPLMYPLHGYMGADGVRNP